MPACVLPSGGASGLEVTWTAREANAVDGDEARRLRTCAGAGLTRVGIRVIDADDPARERVFNYGCEAGNMSPTTRAVEAPEIFLDLRAGTYALTASGRAAEDGVRATATTVAEVEKHAIVAVDLELERAPQPLDLELSGACGELVAALHYADPAADLFIPDGDDPPSLYRQALASDRGLRLGGQAHACAGLEGLHRVPGVDPGRYRLDLLIDGHTCSRAVIVEDSPVQLALDLENPACDG
jgi:hypothetical protein